MADFTMYAGDTKTLEVTVLDEDGDVVDLTGSEIYWQLSRVVDARPGTVEKTVGSGITLTDQVNGVFEVLLDPEDTLSLLGNFYQEVRIVDAESNVSTVLTGTVTITASLIRP